MRPKQVGAGFLFGSYLGSATEGCLFNQAGKKIVISGSGGNATNLSGKCFAYIFAFCYMTFPPLPNATNVVPAC